MSIRHVVLVANRLPASTPVKCVAFILAEHCDESGYCWPSYRRIAQLTCLSERAVARHVRALRESGVLEKVRNGRIAYQGGRICRVSNAYRLRTEVLLSLPPLVPDMGDGHFEVAEDGQVAESGQVVVDGHMVSGDHHLVAESGQIVSGDHHKVVRTDRSDMSEVTTRPLTEPSLLRAKEHSLSETGVSDVVCPPSEPSKKKSTDPLARAAEILGETAFAEEFEQLAELLARSNNSGVTSMSRVVRELYEPLLDFERRIEPAALRSGLRGAIVYEMPNANYVKRAALECLERPKLVAVSRRRRARSDYNDFRKVGEL